MHIIYIHQYFATRSGVTGTRSFEFSKRLLEKGHSVTMITSGCDCPPDMAVPSGREYIEVDIDGINVVPIAAGYNNPHSGTGMSGVQRVRQFMQFAKLAARVGSRLPRPDVVFATHTPLMVGLAGKDLGARFNCPFVFEVRDVWPDALVNCGALKNPFVIWWLRRMSRKIYAAAQEIIAASPGMKAGVVKEGVLPDRVTVITNASDLDLFHPGVDGSPARQRLGLGDRFVAVYFGAMGKANGLEYVVEAARILQDRKRGDLAFVLHGGGGRREAIEALAQEYNLTNVIFSDLVPDKAAVAEIVAACDVGMTIYAGTEKEQTWSPNKMFDTLAAGKPVFINVPGWLAETIEGNACGKFVDPNRPAALADAMEAMAADEAGCAEMGQKSRALAEREFDRNILADRLEAVLQRAVSAYKR